MNILDQAKSKATERRASENQVREKAKQEADILNKRFATFTKSILNILLEIDGKDGFKVIKENNHEYPTKLYRNKNCIAILRIRYSPGEPGKNCEDWGCPESFTAELISGDKYLAVASSGYSSFEKCFKKFRESLAQGLSKYY